MEKKNFSRFNCKLENSYCTRNKIASKTFTNASDNIVIACSDQFIISDSYKFGKDISMILYLIFAGKLELNGVLILLYSNTN